LQNAQASDVLIPGYIDREQSHPKFHPWTGTAYIAFNEGLLRLDSVDYSGQLKMSLTADLEIPQVIAQEDDEFAVTSYEHLFLADAHSTFRCTGVRYVLSEFSNLDDGIVRCAEFEFEGAWKIFVDPGWHFGIRLEGRGAYEQWMRDHQEDESGLREFSWTP
jgi:hypothetical protein